MELFIKIFALLLPLHGAVSVFLPEIFVFWKEGLIVILAFILGVLEFKFWLAHPTSSWKKSFQVSEILAILFLVFLGLLVLREPSFYSLLAARYLGIFFLVFLIFSRFLHFFPQKRQKWFEIFSRYFVLSSAASIFFGIFSKFLGGSEKLAAFYSPVVSSWVPGQALPIFHATSSGTIRISGASSGPIEFSHLILGAFFCLFFTQFSRGVKIFLALLFLFAIYQSYSRAALLALFLGGAIWVGQNFGLEIWRKSQKKFKISVIFLAIFGATLTAFFAPKILTRAGDFDHFVRPLTAARAGLESPIFGALSDFGPAARQRNLKQKNDDRAPIAENVFADYFAQMGVLGLVLALGFWGSIFWRSDKKFFCVLIPAFALANFATIFEMTPIAIFAGILLAFLAGKR